MPKRSCKMLPRAWLRARSADTWTPRSPSPSRSSSTRRTLARQHFLVHLHELERARGADPRRLRRQSRARAAARRCARWAAASISPSRCDRSAAISMPSADRLAVQIALVAGRGLDGMPEGVAEIQDRAQPLLALVLRDHGRLDLAGPVDRVGQRLGLARPQLLPCWCRASRAIPDPRCSRT